MFRHAECFSITVSERVKFLLQAQAKCIPFDRSLFDIQAVIWGSLARTLSGRSGNDIASALVCILERLVADHLDDTGEIVLWSDSCVPDTVTKYQVTSRVQVTPPKSLISSLKHLRPVAPDEGSTAETSC